MENTLSSPAHAPASVPTESFVADKENIISQHHQNVRSHMTTWVQWFIFFVTTNYLAFGWFAQEIFKNSMVEGHETVSPDKRPLIYVATLLISQIIFGTFMSIKFRRWMLDAGDEMKHLYKPNLPGTKGSLFSTSFLAFAVTWGTVGMLCLIPAWIFLASRP